MNDPCLACERIKAAKEGTNPYFIREMRQSYAVVADQQFFRGWVILLFKQHELHLANLERQVQRELYEDLMDIANAMQQVVAPVRINYECLGNTLAHIHWHIVPRHHDDPNPTGPIWTVPKEVRNVEADPELLEQLIGEYRNALADSPGLPS